MLQRQIGQSHLLNNGGHSRGSSVPPGALGVGPPGGPGGGRPGSLMLPPSSTNMRAVELQEKRKQEAEKRRRAEEERQKAAKASEEFYTASGLFEEPQKISSSEDQVISGVSADVSADVFPDR